MPQLAIYIDDQLAKKLDKAIEGSRKSRSKWVADLIRAKLEGEWPAVGKATRVLKRLWPKYERG